MYICTRYQEQLEAFIGAISSAGSEHLVYTEGVGGSNPSSPTKLLKKLRSFLFLYGVSSPVFKTHLLIIPCILFQNDFRLY